MTVAELLAASIASHREYRAAHDRRDALAMQIALAEAARLRREAVALDPTLTDPAFRDRRYPHEALMAFYAEQEAAPTKALRSLPNKPAEVPQ